MAFYEAKRLKIEAWRFYPEFDWPPSVTIRYEPDARYFVSTAHGEREVFSGDYVVKQSNGEMAVFSKSQFEDLYELANPDTRFH